MRRTIHDWLRGAVAAALLIGAVGCGSSTPEPPSYGSDEGAEIAKLIDGVNDDKSTSKRFSAHFAGGTLPKDYKKFPRFDYTLEKSPTVNGASATATVKMRSESTSADAGHKEWAFVKEGNRWKIKSAPLP